MIYPYSRKCIVALLLFLFFKTTEAHNTDSLITVLTHAKEDTNKVLLLNKVVVNYIYNDPSKGKMYAEQMLKLSRQLAYAIGEARSYYFIGIFHWRTSNLKEAELNYTKALAIFDRLGNQEGQSGVYGQLAAMYVAKEQFDKALEYRFKALKICEQRSDKVNEALTLANIAIIYSKLGQGDDAEKYFNKALVLKRKIGDVRGESIVLTNLGALLHEKGKNDAAMASFRNALTLQEKFKDMAIIVTCKANIANILNDQNKLDEALKLYNECYEIYRADQDTNGMALEYISIGNVQEKKGNYKEAVLKYNEAIGFLKNIENRDLMRRAYTGLCKSYMGLKDYKKASECTDKLSVITETIFNKELTANIAELKEKYEAEKRERDILLLEEKNAVTAALSEKRKFGEIALSSAAIILLLGLLLIIAFNRNRKKQKEIEFVKAKAHLEQTALRAQMNPHFVFNALNSIQHYILNKDTEYAYDYLAKFSKLIRQVLINSEQNTISLDKEIETLRLYMELEQRRFKNRFDFEIRYAEDFPAEDIIVPTMLVQPFVENAIWHGIMNLPENENGRIEVGFSLEGRTLHIYVEDNGVGRKEAALRKVKNGYTSVGVLFTQKRLELLKEITKQNTEITIRDLVDEKGNACGTKVEIAIEVLV